ncbi:MULTISPECIES: amidohydrolase family protein [Streptomyces]|uniref:Amidohydrolase family protein n=1 Tax=Streptomyces glycanivorans TaxID=3033808 RepID=A0ABY9JAI4_9ACTN|nr:MULTISPECIES: amidohydrolase family protein [unclassified Streptomyces]WSQ76793.1 amidohydrolase family protein [Streptomyces sp. NBC_01213]TXS19126.1 amidohydrolase [Streptomyces sp. wa22]WLQ63283.1 amidohydrolase family protein [Streptomyces sp. Alt3]WSQ84126.1 amidohydrolase family protein [Streptomyces sp. NBC_01212]WSR09928.1 amidohydrolase family protein [Streptomyces sp. NBC_01208]
MCVEALPPPSGRLTRRGILAGAAALAGTVAAAAPAVSADRDAAPARTAPGAAERAAGLVIRGGTLLDPATGEVTENAVVVIRDGTVRAAGPRGSVSVPDGAEVLEAHGRWVLPGLVDAHIHLSTAAEARDAVRQGATSARSGSTSFYQDIAVRELARHSPDLAPRLTAAGVFVTPDLGETVLADPDLTPLARLKDGVRSAEALRRVVEVNIARGADVIKTRVNERAGLPEQDPLTQVYSHEQLSEIVTAARRRGKGVLCHSYSEQGCHDAVTAGIRSLEHGAFVGERTLAEMRRRGTYFTPTLTAIAGLAQSSDPVLAERGRTYLPVLKRAVLAAHELGVPLAAGTDSSGGTVRPIGREVELMRAAGLPALDAIRTATTGAARLLGLERTVGRLARGFAGDAVLLDGDPLADVSVLTRPVRVVRAGIAL